MKLSIQTTYDLTSSDPCALCVVDHKDGTYALCRTTQAGGVSIHLTTPQALTLLTDLASALIKGGSS